MADKIENIGSSLVQHGDFNDRIYLMKLDKDDFPDIIDKLELLASNNDYSKIFAKIPADFWSEFEKGGYEIEAEIPDFYANGRTALFLGKFFDENRSKLKDKDRITDVIRTAENKKTIDEISSLNNRYELSQLGKNDAEKMVKVYEVVFDTYPFPIHDPEYIKKTMDENFVYFGIWKDDKLVALSSSEMDNKEKNVEMTDFAALPEHRGNNFAIHLLEKMEKAMKKKGIKTFYTIARSQSYGMNITFAKMGYQYSGTLKNNTNIAGNLESMNIWYKPADER